MLPWPSDWSARSSHATANSGAELEPWMSKSSEPRIRSVPWRQASRGGSIEDRKLREVTVSLPPELSGITPLIPSSLGAAMDEALREIATLDESHGAQDPDGRRA